MSVLPIRIVGDSTLHAPADMVTVFDDSLHTLVEDMYETMDAAPGVGLAAPQVGVSLRIFTYGWLDDDDRLWRGVAINPQLWLAPTVPGIADPDYESEGCLSVPGERFGLRRSDKVLLRAVDLDGVPFEIAAEGWLARIFQHEFDHLDGVLYIDRISDNDQRIVNKIIRKRQWGVPGRSWLPGTDNLDG